MAGRIPEYFIDDLVSRTDIVDVVSSVVKLKKSGQNWHGLCPFHNEKTPSFTVSQDKQFYHCFGCGAHGNAVGFLMEHDQLSFVEAIEELAKQQGMEVPREENPRQAQQRKANQKSLEVMELTSQFYIRHLQDPQTGSNARNYIDHRGLTPETVQKFGIGYAPDAWDGLKKHLSDKQITEQEQVNFGLLVQKEETGRTYDRFRDRVMFPIRDFRGKVIAFGGRVLGDAKPKYLNSPETSLFQKGKELYGLYEARTSGSLERLLVVEGYMDVVALAQAGIHYSVATLGTSATSDHMEKLFKLVSEVVFCFDGDAAGIKAAERALDNVLPYMTDGRQARFLFLPQGEDPDSLISKVGKNLFEQRIVRAAPLSEYLFWQIGQGLDLQQPEARAQLKQRAIPLLQRIPTGLLQTLLVQKLAEQVGVSTEQLTPLLSQHSGNGGHTDYFPAEPAEHYAESAFVVAEGTDDSQNLAHPYLRKLLIWLLRKPAILSALNAEETQTLNTLTENNQADQIAYIMKKVMEYLNSEPGATTQSILAHWYGTPEGEQLSRLATEDILIPADTVESEFKAWLHALEQKRAEQKHSRRLDELMSKSRSGQTLTRSEKEELVMLLQAGHSKQDA